MPRLFPWRLLIAFANLNYCVGAFYFDYGPTHVLNPRWPPHARFHNGQTMSLGLLLCGFTLWSIFRPAKTPQQELEQLWLGVLVGSMYCLAGFSAILYPGTDWTDPEFLGKDAGPIQKWLFPGIVIVQWIGYWAERQRLMALGGGGKKVA